MKERNLLKITGQAIEDYHMIQDHDTIWVGISTAPKSLVALLFLSKRLAYIPITYSLQPIHIITPGEEVSLIQSWYQNLRDRFSLPPLVCFPLPAEGYTLYHHAPRKAVLQALLHVTGKQGGKLALGDSLEDITLAALSALFYHHRWAPLLPHLPLSRFPLSIIRPLAYLSQRQITTYTREYDIPYLRPSTPPPLARERLFALMKHFQPLTPHPLQQVFAALRNPKKDYFLHRQ